MADPHASMQKHNGTVCTEMHKHPHGAVGNRTKPYTAGFVAMQNGMVQREIMKPFGTMMKHYLPDCKT